LVQLAASLKPKTGEEGGEEDKNQSETGERKKSPYFD